LSDAFRTNFIEIIKDQLQLFGKEKSFRGKREEDLHLTQDSESEVERDDDGASVACQNRAIVRVAPVPFERLAVDENYHRVLGLIAGGACSLAS